MEKFVLALLLSSFSSVVLADELGSSNNWVSGIGYMNLSGELEGGGVEANLGGIVGSLGYKFEAENNVYFIPEARLGVGVNDDSVAYLGG